MVNSGWGENVLEERIRKGRHHFGSQGKSSFEPFGSLKTGWIGLSTGSDGSMTVQRLAGSKG